MGNKPLMRLCKMDSSGFCRTSPGLPSSGSDSPAPSCGESCGGRSGMPVAEDIVWALSHLLGASFSCLYLLLCRRWVARSPVRVDVLWT